MPRVACGTIFATAGHASPSASTRCFGICPASNSASTTRPWPPGRAEQELAARPAPEQPFRFAIEGPRRNYYARHSESSDWFFAVGGYTYWYTADVDVGPTSTPGVQPRLRMTLRPHVF